MRKIIIKNKKKLPKGQACFLEIFHTREICNVQNIFSHAENLSGIQTISKTQDKEYNILDTLLSVSATGIKN